MRILGRRQTAGVAVVMIAAGCSVPAYAPRAVPVQSAPVIVHVMTLQQPPGAGRVRLTLSTRPNSIGGFHQEYEAVGEITARDELGEWRFGYVKLDLNTYDLDIFGLHAVRISLRNATADTLEIDWSRTVIVDASGRARPVMHRGVKLADRDRPGAPSVVPPGASIEDFMFPSDGITFRALGRSSFWAAPAFVEAFRAGDQFSVTVALRNGDRQMAKTFRFLGQAE